MWWQWWKKEKKIETCTLKAKPSSVAFLFPS
jgi:hypothetical protein